MSVFKDMIAQAVFTTAVDRLTKAAKKNGLDREEFTAVVDAIRQKHYPVSAQPSLPLGRTAGSAPEGATPSKS